MEWNSILITIFSSLLSGGCVAWGVVKLCVRKIADDAISEHDEILDEKFTTRERMQIERKELLKEVEEKFLTLYAFREFERRIEEHFETTDRRFADSSKRFDKIDGSLEHITELLIKRG